MPVLTKTISNYEKQLIQRLITQEALINNAFNDLVRRVSPHLSKWRANNRNSVWIRNSRIENAIEMELATFHQDVVDIIQAQQKAGWNLSDMKNDSIFKNYIQGMSLSNTVKEGLFTRNADALAAFQSRKLDGIDLSNRVWNLAAQNKEHIELFLQGGIATGRSAVEIGRDLRQYLNNPDKRFRRVRNPKTGKLELSKPAQNYHPGQGVYRSSVQNALRISRTETNIAYRSADHERWKDNETVLGVEVKLSNAHPMVDICDYMQGQYPKNFKFIGWHPNCICYSVPVLLSQDDFVKHLYGDLDASKQYVQTLPNNANKYIAANTTRFRGWKNEPYWLQDNFVFKNGAYVPKVGRKVGIKPTVTQKPVVKPNPQPQFIEAKTVAEAEAIAKRLNLADNVGYRDVDVVTANQWNKSVFETIQQFPELRKGFEFIGSIQERNRFYVDLKVNQIVKANHPTYQYYNRMYGHAEAIKKLKAAIRRRAIEKTKNEWLAISTSRPGMKGVTVNAMHGKNHQKLMKILEHEVAIKRSPAGCTKIKSLIDHELGHEIDKLLNLRSDPFITNLFYSNKALLKEKLCAYGSTNVAEFIAEAWSEYMNNPKPRDLARLVGDYILKKHKKMFP